MFGIDPAENKKILDTLFKNFRLVLKQTTNVDEQIFLDMKFGFFTNSLTEEEIAIYLYLWEWGLSNWKSRTDDKMGPFEFITLDIQIWQYIRILRMANKELNVDVTPDTPGFMAEALYAKTGSLRDKVWPRIISRRKIEEEPEEPETEDEFEEVQMYRVGDDELTQDEYDGWVASLDPNRKVAMLGHVLPFMKKISKGVSADE
jgi:hypothetical protein